VTKQKHGPNAATVYHTELESSSGGGADEQRLASGITAGVHVQPEQGEEEGVTAAGMPSQVKRRDSGLFPPNSPVLKGSVVGQLSMLTLAEEEEEEEAGEERGAAAAEMPGKVKRRDSGVLPLYSSTLKDRGGPAVCASAGRSISVEDE